MIILEYRVAYALFLTTYIALFFIEIIKKLSHNLHLHIYIYKEKLSRSLPKFSQWNRSCREEKAFFGVEKVQMAIMHCVSTISIYQVLRKCSKSCSSYTDFGKLLKEGKRWPICLHILHILHCCFVARQTD